MSFEFMMRFFDYWRNNKSGSVQPYILQIDVDSMTGLAGRVSVGGGLGFMKDYKPSLHSKSGSVQPYILQIDVDIMTDLAGRVPVGGGLGFMKDYKPSCTPKQDPS
jgi:hypothetical protein